MTRFNSSKSNLPCAWLNCEAEIQVLFENLYINSGVVKFTPDIDVGDFVSYQKIKFHHLHTYEQKNKREI